MRISDWSSDVCSSDLLSWWVKLADGDAIVALHDADFRQTLRRWSQGPGQLSKLASSDGQLSGDERYFAPCTAVSEAIFCVEAAAALPPRLVRIDHSGRKQVIDSPNPNPDRSEEHTSEL